MNIDLNSVEIKFSNDINEEILKCLKVIFTTPVGTVAFDRDFGVDFSILDLPLPQAKAKLTVEYVEKVKKYEPRAAVKSVNFMFDALNGMIKPEVKIYAIN